ncbi:MAG: hypothetical protein WCX31_20170 [Salinivirgaceae bacterium]|jgi:hypothetical protein
MTSQKLIKILVVSILFLEITSCTCNRSEKQLPKQTLIQDTLDTKKDSKTEYFSMPSPEEILTYFYSNQLVFHSNIICSTKNIEKYLENESQLQMIGVFSSDLAYLTIYKKQNEILDYFSAIQNLAEKTKISSAFDKNIISQVIGVQNDIDSLAEIARNSYIKLLSYLITFEKQNQLSVILYGAYIESIYLSLDYIESYSENNELIQKIANQKYAFDNLYNFSKQYLSPDRNAIQLSNLEKLNNIYSSLTITNSNDNSVTNAENGKMVLGGSEEIVMNEIQFNQLKSLINELRTELIK